MGTIESELLLEYLRGPPLVLEVHDRDQIPTEEVTKGALFGTIQSDPLIGTYAYSKGMNTITIKRTMYMYMYIYMYMYSESLINDYKFIIIFIEVQKKTQSGINPYGVVNLDLSTFLDGILTMEYTLPILNKIEQGLYVNTCTCIHVHVLLLLYMYSTSVHWL